IAHIENEKQQRQIQLDQLMQEHKEKETARNETQASLQQLKLQQEQTRQQILHTQGEVENLRVNLAAENRKLDAKVNEHDLLKSLVDSMDGYPESVKYLHQNAQWKQDAPLLSDIIYAGRIPCSSGKPAGALLKLLYCKYPPGRLSRYSPAG
ncbi:MAG TPA: hypothetical protein PLN30_03925, partial [Ferruginibacter sp.]|nr:hypothetical protein [Ferruginibacter sp.]